MPARISPQTKYACVKSLEEGNSVSEVARNSGFSRITIYKWMATVKQGELVDPFKKKKEKAQDKKTKLRERKICALAVEYPSFSIRKLSDLSGFSTTYVWKTLKKHILSTKEARTAKQRIVLKRRRRLTPIEKKAILRSYQISESVTGTCVKNNISRTTFYTIYKRYQELDEIDFEKDLTAKYPKGSAHYRYKKDMERRVLRAVLKRPESSVRSITSEINKNTVVSVSLVYTVLRRHKLHTVTARNTYKSSNKFVVIHELRMLRNDVMQRIVFNKFSVPTIPAELVKEFAYGVAFPVGVVGCIAVYVVSAQTLGPVISEKTDYLGRLTSAFSASVGWNNATQVSQSKDDKLLGKEFDFSLFTPEENTSQQSGEWGAIALNTSQSVYLPSEKVQLGFTVLDSHGNGVCRPNATINIIDPGGRKSIYSTTTGTIRTGPECGFRTINTAFDHAITYSGLKEGRYDVALEILNAGVSQTAQTSFFVTTTLPVSVEREAATRIWPRADYPMTITIKAGKGFEGEVRETLPAGFTIRESAEYEIQHYPDKQVIAWQVSVRPGEEKQLKYVFDAPDASPAFFTVPPLSIWGSNGNIVFKEPRSWQMAIDGLE